MLAFQLLAASSYVLGAVSSQGVLAASEGNSAVFDIGVGFAISYKDHQLEISRDGSEVWSTTTNEPFIRASAGNDSVTGSNGAFNITQVDIDTTNGQNIADIELVDWDQSALGKAAQVSGQLTFDGAIVADYALSFWVPSDLADRVAFYLDITSLNEQDPPKKLYFRYHSNPAEDFYGLGAQASFASLKNRSIPIITREQGVGRGDEPITSIANANGSIAGGSIYTTYTSVPSYISTEGKVFYLSEKSTGYANFDFTQANAVTVRYDSLSVDGAFTKTGNLFDAIEALTAYTGRQPSLPRWVDDGAILGIQGGQDKVNRIVKQGLDLGAPIAGVWLQDWVGTHSQVGPYMNISRLWWNWENDDVLYPTWTSFVQSLRDKHNVRTLAYINTFLTNVSTKDTSFRRNLYDEASAQRYFVQNATTGSTAIISSGPGLQAGVVDLTNPQLRTWLEDVIRKQIWNANISGFMTDFGEYTPLSGDVKIYDSVSDAFFYHNAYPTQWAEYHRSIVKALGLQDEAVLFHRSAAQSSQKYMNLFWVGDQNVDWGVNDGIKSVVTIMLHMGFCGYSQQHSDVGGYTTVLTYSNYNITRSPELLARWGELAAVSSAVFRSHEGNIPSVNAQFYSNTTTYEYFGYNARLFAALGKYRRHILETESEPKGWPLLRPVVLYHPEDLKAREISYQSFYLGADLYVAPVLDPQTFELEVYLPAGDGNRTYEHVWTGKVYLGGQDVVVPTPFGKPAVFLVNGARTPELQPFLDFVSKENATLLTVV